MYTLNEINVCYKSDLYTRYKRPMYTVNETDVYDQWIRQKRPIYTKRELQENFKGLSRTCAKKT